MNSVLMSTDNSVLLFSGITLLFDFTEIQFILNLVDEHLHVVIFCFIRNNFR